MRWNENILHLKLNEIVEKNQRIFHLLTFYPSRLNKINGFTSRLFVATTYFVEILFTQSIYKVSIIYGLKHYTCNTNSFLVAWKF